MSDASLPDRLRATGDERCVEYARLLEHGPDEAFTVGRDMAASLLDRLEKAEAEKNANAVRVAELELAKVADHEAIRRYQASLAKYEVWRREQAERAIEAEAKAARLAQTIAFYHEQPDGDAAFWHGRAKEAEAKAARLERERDVQAAVARECCLQAGVAHAAHGDHDGRWAAAWSRGHYAAMVKRYGEPPALPDRLRATGSKRREWQEYADNMEADSLTLHNLNGSIWEAADLLSEALAESDAEVARLREQLDLFIAGQEAMRDRAEAAEAERDKLGLVNGTPAWLAASERARKMNVRAHEASKRAMQAEAKAARLERERDVQVETLPRRLHEAYERLAPTFGYKTRPETAVPWAEVPEDNKLLMEAAVAAAILAAPDDASEPPSPAIAPRHDTIFDASEEGTLSPATGSEP